MLHEKTETAVQETANELLDWKKYGTWKTYNPDVPIDANTLLQRKNVRNNSKLFETMALNLLVDES